MVKNKKLICYFLEGWGYKMSEIKDIPSEMNTLITSFVKAKPDEDLTLDELTDKIRKLYQIKQRKHLQDLREKGEKYVYVERCLCQEVSKQFFRVPIDDFKSLSSYNPDKWYEDECYIDECETIVDKIQCDLYEFKEFNDGDDDNY